MSKSLWTIQINFHNEKHDTVATIKLPESEYDGSETMEQVVYPEMTSKLHELKWAGFGLWAQHESIYKQTTLDEVNYQRVNGLLVLDCENHNCKWRAITVPVVKNDDCVLCSVELTDSNRSYPKCFHSCMCRECVNTIDKCPICRKPFNSNKNKTLI